ncbi:MAG: GNAT family N-acetyltransferase [bacterium]|nr:GNAT family N-acetyltransferase [bacterium]
MPAQVPNPTPRIRFRRYQLDDAPAVANMFGDPEVQRFYPAMTSISEAQQWIEWNLGNYATHGFGLWVAEHRQTGSFLGDCGLTLQPVEGRHLLEVGYHLQAPHRGYGYATEAGRACIAYAFDVLEAPFVCSIVDPTNARSSAVASRLHESQRTFTNDEGCPKQLYWSNPA